MKPKFKVGDWVMTNEVGVTPAGGHNEDTPGGYGFVPNKKLRIAGITGKGVVVYWFDDHRDGIYEGNFTLLKEHYLRKFKQLYERRR